MGEIQSASMSYILIQEGVFMDKLNILLICGSGASTGFMAANMRKEAAKQGLDWEIAAHSESELEEYADGIDCLMLGPHLAYLQDEVTKRYGGKNIKIAVMEKRYYSTLDAASALKHIKSLF
jgi:PTS system cellobiose-specific IIB component